jgi:hypothetical protein
MKTILIKYITLGIFIISLIYLIKLVDKQSREIRDLKDIHTSELCTIDSLQQVHIVTEKQFKRIILSKDSLLKSELEKKDLKIKQLDNVIKANINTTKVIRDTILNNIEIIKDTCIPIIKSIDCITLHETLEINNEKLYLTIDSLDFDINITIIDYRDIIYWYNFRKRKEFGYSTIGFRNHYISKITATSDCFKDKIKIQSYKIKK